MMLSFVLSPSYFIFRPARTVSTRRIFSVHIHRRHPQYKATKRTSRPDNERTKNEQPVKATANVVLEGDLIAYRTDVEASWKIAAVTYASAQAVELADVHVRATRDDGRLEVFVDWQLFNSAITIQLDKINVTPLETDFETRVIEDRVSNPHGEESEDCWRIHPSELQRLSLTIPYANAVST